MANNSVAEEKSVIRLVVQSPLQASLEPRQVHVDAGKSVSFNCTWSGGGGSSGNSGKPTFSWFFNGKPLSSGSGSDEETMFQRQRIRLVEPSVLNIQAVSRQDVGK